MTLHHDKLAYGRLKSLRSDLGEERLAVMVAELNSDDGDEDKNKSGKVGDKSADGGDAGRDE